MLRGRRTCLCWAATPSLLLLRGRYLVAWTNATANQLSWEIWKGAQASVSLVPKGQVLVPDGTVRPNSTEMLVFETEKGLLQAMQGKWVALTPKPPTSQKVSAKYFERPGEGGGLQDKQSTRAQFSDWLSNVIKGRQCDHEKAWGPNAPDHQVVNFFHLVVVVSI